MRRRQLSREESALWDTLRQSVRPLRPARLAAGGDAPAAAPPGTPAAVAPAPVPAAVRTKPRPPAAPPPPPPLVPLEERIRRRLQRGLAEVDGRIDLHGMRQERAFAALTTFLRASQLRGSRIVLVITGKGRGDTGGQGGGEGRGVLRHRVPLWLARPEFRDLVVGVEPAGRRHGGEGALYIRIRRRDRRPGAPMDR